MSTNPQEPKNPQKRSRPSNQTEETPNESPGMPAQERPHKAAGDKVLPSVEISKKPKARHTRRRPLRPALEPMLGIDMILVEELRSEHDDLLDWFNTYIDRFGDPRSSPGSPSGLICTTAVGEDHLTDLLTKPWVVPERGPSQINELQQEAYDTTKRKVTELFTLIQRTQRNRERFTKRIKDTDVYQSMPLIRATEEALETLEDDEDSIVTSIEHLLLEFESQPIFTELATTKTKLEELASTAREKAVAHDVVDVIVRRLREVPKLTYEANLHFHLPSLQGELEERARRRARDQARRLARNRARQAKGLDLLSDSE